MSYIPCNLNNISCGNNETIHSRTYRPRGEVFQMLRLGLASIIMTGCSDCLVPSVRVGVALRCDIVGHTIDDEIGNNLGEVYIIAKGTRTDHEMNRLKTM